MTNKPATTTLDTFHPTSIDDITDPSPADVVEAFEMLDSWGTEIRVNDQTTPYLVGRLVEQSPRTYEVYYQPESPAGTGVAGTISFTHQFDAPEDDRVTFHPAAADDADNETVDTPSEETESEDQPVILVEELHVEAHTRTEQLDAVLPLVRDELMESDWVVDPGDLDKIDLSKGRFLVSPDDIDDPESEPWLPVRADTGYGEWITAVNKLADFRTDAYDDAPFALEVSTILKARTMHGIARYPLDAARLVSHSDTEIIEDGGNPEALRTLLLDYAIENISLETVDIPLTAATKSTDQ